MSVLGFSIPEGEHSKTARETLGHLIRNDGFRALYKGLTPILLRAMIGNIALFSGFNLTMSIFSQLENAGLYGS
jgi:hypothetical protein